MSRRIFSVFITVLFVLGIFENSIFIYAEKNIDITKSQVISSRETYASYISSLGKTPPPTQKIVLEAENSNTLSGKTYISNEYDGQLYTETDSEIQWKLNVKESGYYCVGIRYFPADGTGSAIERSLKLDGSVPFREAEYLTMERIFCDDIVDGFRKDKNGNEIKPSQKEIKRWIETDFNNPSGTTNGSIQIYLSEGTHSLSLYALKEPVVLDKVILHPKTDQRDYKEVYNEYIENDYKLADRNILIQAENVLERSNLSITAQNDNSSYYTIPQDAVHRKLNTLGGANWKYSGQWVSWKINVKSAGLYRIGIRYRQNITSGTISGRILYIDGNIPFKEAGNIAFEYSSDWNKKFLGNDEGEFYFYLTEGEHEIALEAIVYEKLSELLNSVQNNLTELNKIYRSILMITGSSPDLKRDYNFPKLLDEEIKQMKILSESLYDAEEKLINLVGEKGESSSLLNKLAYQLDLMSKQPKKIASNLESFKSNVGSLGTWLITMQEQPLEIDYISLVGKNDADFSKKEYSFLDIWFSIKYFLSSFVNDYDSFAGEDEQQNITVWATTGRDQAKVIRQLIDNDFSANHLIGVNLQLVPATALLTAVLGGTGPDIALMLASTEPINYAVRGAAVDLTQFDDFDQISKRFYQSAMIPLSFNGKVYGLPETQTFPMLFYRTDIFEEFGLKVPETWNDFYRLIPQLQKNKMEIGYQSNLAGLQIFMYQRDIELYNDNGATVNLECNESLDCFKQLMELYTKYTFPTEYDFANRFRTGEMPIAIQDYTLYNQLTVFAPEIKGLWAMTHVPGTQREDGSINIAAPSNGTASMMLSGTKNKDASWEFLKWWSNTEVCSQFAKELETLMGQGAKYATANIEAFESLSFTKKEYDSILEQWDNAVGTPEVPGSYYTTRIVTFAFNKVYSERLNPEETLLDYVPNINAELKRKRIEFGIE